MQKWSVFKLFKGHNAVDSWSPRDIILFSFSYLNTFFSSSNVEEFRPVGFKVKLYFTPFEDMDAGKHLGRLPNHDVQFATFLVDLGRFESVELRLVFGDKLVAYRAKIVIVSVINETEIRIV